MPEVRVERRVAAPPEAVYPYLIDSTLWAGWQGEDAFIEPRPDGNFMMRSPNGLVARGKVLAVEPDRSIAFTWGWEDLDSVPPGSTTVMIELIPDGDGTLVRLTHRDLPVAETSLHRRGWEHYLDRLAVSAEGGDPGPDPGVGG